MQTWVIVIVQLEQPTCDGGHYHSKRYRTAQDNFNMDLVSFNQFGLELVINNTTGETFASVSAVGRMTDKPSQTISRYVNGKFKGCTQMQLLEAEVVTNGGLQGVNLLNENQILEVVARYKPDLLIKFAQLGLRAYLHTIAGYQISSTAVQLKKAPAKTFNPNYLPDRKEAMDKLKEHGATGRVYGAVESYNNALVGIENGKRHEVDELQAYKLGSNYGAVRRELSKRPLGFAKHANHLINTSKQAMRYENYAIAGTDSVPEALKPKKERKQLKAQ